MPSATRGSILISTANDIGEALVEKLGGVGYSPNEWKDKINLCGIAPVDSASALSVLADSAGTGDERGSILIATADAIGAILNKKYNVLRGFKPKEWASACHKMKALEEGSVASASIASFSDGADTVPLTSCVCNIDANLDGKSAVVCKHTGKSVFLPMDIEQGTISGSGYNSDSTARVRTAERKAVSPSTQYKIKVNSEVQIYEVHEYADLTGSSTHLTANASEYTFTTKSTTNYLRILFRYSNNATIRPSAITELQVTDGALYWETKTADLGRTIYGGSVDIITGEGTDENGNDFTFEPVKIDSFPGVNNIWNDCGNTAVGYYQAPTPYTRKTATGGIANFSDQRTDLPLTKAIANIAPSIAGKSAVNLIRAGKNLYDIDEAEYNGEFYDASGNVVQYADCAVSWIKVNPSTKYSFSCTKETSQSVNVRVAWCKSDKSFISRQGLFSDNQFPMTLTTPSNCEWLQLSVNQYGASSIAQNNWSIQVEQSEASTTFEPYNGTTYAAELGETVYGGSVDFVSGEVKQSSILIDLSTIAASSWNMGASDRFRARLTQYQTASGWSGNWQNTVSNVFVCEDPSTLFNNRSNYSFANIPQNYYNFDIKVPSGQFENATEFAAWLANTDGNGKHAIIVIDRAEVISSSIPGRVISPIEGVNNYWNDAGGDTEIQYFEDET